MKKEALSPELLDENQNITRADFPNIELNLLLQKKSKFNPFGTTSWKVFLFPSLLNIDSVTKKHNSLALT